MSVGIARAVRLAPARTCRDCCRWPCGCSSDDGMPEFALRIEPCACGTAIAAGGQASTVRRAVEAHNATLAHATWRAKQDLATLALERG